MEKEITERKAVEALTDYFNQMNSNEHKFAEYLSLQHRYLQEKVFEAILLYIVKLSHNFKRKQYDDRNNFACFASNKIVEELRRLKIYDERLLDKELAKMQGYANDYFFTKE